MRIFFVCQGKRSFFEKDVKLLREFSQVEVFDRYPPGLGHFFALWGGIRRCDVLLVWFLGRHAVAPISLAKLLRKKIVVVAGGWDVACCPEIDYGLMRPGPIRRLARLLFGLADQTISVSRSNRKEAVENALIDPLKNVLIYHGFEDEADEYAAAPKKQEVITIGDVTRGNLTRKGLGDFVRAAGELPDFKFVLVGAWKDDSIGDLRKVATPNVEFTGYLEGEVLRRRLARAAVYAQFSAHEAFGSSLAEAMLFGCVPVVSNRYALPEVVADCGYVVPYGDCRAAAEAIRRALGDREKGGKARERVRSFFRLEDRGRRLKELLCEVAR